MKYSSLVRCQPNLIFLWPSHLHSIFPMAYLICPDYPVSIQLCHLPSSGICLLEFSHNILFTKMSTSDAPKFHALFVDFRLYCFYLSARISAFSSQLTVSTILLRHFLSQKPNQLFSGLLRDTVILDIGEIHIYWDNEIFFLVIEISRVKPWEYSIEKSWIIFFIQCGTTRDAIVFSIRSYSPY